MNIYIVLSNNNEYIAAFTTESRAKEFIGACNQGSDYFVRVDWLIDLDNIIE